jgi:hypothetical protein
MEIETINDLKSVLKETGYSKQAIAEIIRWYESDLPIK